MHQVFRISPIPTNHRYEVARTQAFDPNTTHEHAIARLQKPGHGLAADRQYAFEGRVVSHLRRGVSLIRRD